jgi:hypothetical protein
MTREHYQELAEKILISAMDGGELAGMVFRHSDSPLKSLRTSIIAKAGPPVPQLDGPRGRKVEVEITIKTDRPSISAQWHGLVLERILSVPILRAAALSAGMTADDDFLLFDEEIGGDRMETANLRKRTITVPVLLVLH